MSEEADRILALMTALGLAGPQDKIATTQLTGGVSSDIVLVKTGQGQFCVKFALPKLKVAADWQVPVSRNAAEYEWLSYVAGINPDWVPRLFGQDAELGGFAMAFLPPDRFPNWKALLMNGSVDVPFAAAVGAALGRIHETAATDPTIGPRFANQDNFYALRLEPYLAYTATRHPDLGPRLNALVDSFHAARISLVHGDVSPKNILSGPEGPVFLDAECAVQGDPAFDPAFCLNHLVIKASAAIADPAHLAQAARSLWAAYAAQVDWEDIAGIEARVAGLLPALMLGRVDGKSPVEYLDPAGQDRLRQLARRFLLDPTESLGPIIAAAQEAGESL